MSAEKLRIGADDGHGNEVQRFGDGTTLGELQRGDIIRISNREGCVIATYKVW